MLVRLPCENYIMKKVVFRIIPVILSLVALTACTIRTETVTLPAENITVTQTSTLTITEELPPVSPYPVLQITGPANNASLHNNVVIVTGTATPGASVTIAGNNALVGENGSFLGYALLSEGLNAVAVIAETGGHSVADIITLTFTPPLYIRLDSPPKGIDYLHNPLVATGRVNYPQASVTVNGIPATVFSDGTFTALVQLNEEKGGYLYAVAVLGDEIQLDDMHIIVPFGPLWLGGPIRYIHSEFERVSLEAGRTFSQMMKLVTYNSISERTPCEYFVTPVEHEHLQGVVWPPGLEVEILPPDFLFYPGGEYNLLMAVTASADIPPGDYYCSLKTSFEGDWGFLDILKITVLPPGSIEG
jgi:hypothetical protein